MSKEDVVLKVLNAIDDEHMYCRADLIGMNRKAIAIEEQQRRVIEAVRRDTLWNPYIKEELAALDKLENDK
jgi:hypothetical protein